MRKLGKIVLATLVGAMILACASCKRDDPSVSGATFKLSEMTYMGQTVPASDDMSMSIKFNADGTCVMTDVEDGDTEGTWTQDGTSVIVVLGDVLKYSMTVSSDGSILTWTVTMGGQSGTYTFTRK